MRVKRYAQALGTLAGQFVLAATFVLGIPYLSRHVVGQFSDWPTEKQTGLTGQTAQLYSPEVSFIDLQAPTCSPTVPGGGTERQLLFESLQNRSSFRLLRHLVEDSVFSRCLVRRAALQTSSTS